MAGTPKLENLGPVSTRWLAQVGVTTVEDLRSLGVVETYRRVKAEFPRRVNVLLLYALHGAVDGVHWNTYSPAVKAQMRAEVEDPAAGPPGRGVGT